MKYRDLDIFFTKNTSTNDISFVAGTADIVQSIKNIVLTQKGERPFNKSFGTGVTGLLFESPSIAELSLLKVQIFEALEKYEPRITVSDIAIDYPIDAQSTDIVINITYTIDAQSKTANTQTLILTVTQI